VILRPYQIDGARFLAARRHALLADEMRVGKTPQAIVAADLVCAQRVLVLCPAIGVDQWVAEWRRWSSQREVERFIDGPLGKGVVVSSYARASLHASFLSSIKWDVVIADEAHAAKNPHAARTKLVYGREGVGWNSRRLWALTGTPAGRHAGELWPMLRAFGVVKLDYAAFLSVYCDMDPLTQRVYGTKARRIPELREMLATVMLRRLRSEVSPHMEPISYEFLEGGSTYDELDPLRVPEADDRKTLTWIEQRKFDPTLAAQRIAVARSKVPTLLCEITSALENDLYKKTVVFGTYQEPLHQLATKLTNASYRAAVLNGATPEPKRAQIQRDFRDGDLQVICANIQTAGTAIDLSAASHGYFLELDWVPANNVQAANRLVSLSKKEPVTFDILTHTGSIDDRVQRVLIRRVKQLSQLY